MSLSSAPIESGDYYLEVNFKEGKNTKAAKFGFGLTVQKATDLGKTVQRTVNVKLSSNEETYTVDLAECLKDKGIRTGGDLAVNDKYGGIGQS